MKVQVSRVALLLMVILIIAAPVHGIRPDRSSDARRQLKTVPSITPGIQSVPGTALQHPDPSKFIVSKAGVIDASSSRAKIALTQLSNGKILAAWNIEVSADGTGAGEAAFFDENMNRLNSVYYTTPSKKTVPSNNSVIPLTDDTAVIAFGDTIKKNGQYVVVNDQGRIVKGPVVFCDSTVHYINLTPMPGGKSVLLSYEKQWGATGRGEFLVMNSSGDIIIGPVVFNNKGYTTDIGPAVLDGLIWLNYNCGHSKSKIFDFYGSVVRDEVRYGTKKVGLNKPFVKDNGNILLVHVNDQSKGMVLELNRKGSIVKSPFPFTSDDLTFLNASRLAGGNIFVMYTFKDGWQFDTKIILLDRDGKRIKELAPLDDKYRVNYWSCAHTVLKNGKVLLVYSGPRKGSDPPVNRITLFKIVNI